MSALRPELILFDAVGTLIEPDPPVVTVYQRCGDRHGCRLTEVDLRGRFSDAFALACMDRRAEREGRTNEAAEYEFWEEVVNDVFDELSTVAADNVFDELWNHFAQPQHWRVFDDVAPTFTELQRRGYQIGIASNFDQRLLRICAGHPELADVDPVFVSSRVGWAKPAPSFYREIERLTNLPPERILLVGDDQENDVLVPRQLGWQTQWLKRINLEDPPSHLSSLTDLLALPELIP